MNVVIFCDMSSAWLTPLQGVRSAELPLCGKPLLSHILSLIGRSDETSRLWLVGAAAPLLKTAAAAGGFTLMNGAPPRIAETDTLVVGAAGLLACDFADALHTHQAQGNQVTLLTVPLPAGSRAPQLRLTGDRLRTSDGRGVRYADTGYAIIRAGMPITPQVFSQCERSSVGLYQKSVVWEPICSVSAYLHCQRAVLNGWLEAGGHKRLDGLLTPSTDSFPQAEFEPPVYLGHRVRIGADSVLSQSVIGNGVTIGSGVALYGCTVQDGAYIGDGVQARDALICSDAMLMNGCRLEPGSAVGEGASIGEHAVVEAQVRVFAGKRVAPRTTAELDVRYSSVEALSLEEERVCGMLTPASAIRLGSCLAEAGRTIAVGYAPGFAAKALAAAVCAGCSAAGGRVVLVPDSVLPELCYASVQAHTDLLLHIEAGAEVSLRLLAEGGLPLTEEQEDMLERALETRSVAQVPHTSFGDITEFCSSGALYELSLQHMFPACRRPDVSVSTSDARLRRLGTKLYAGSAEQTGILLQLSADGRHLSVYSDQTGFIRYERVLLLCCLALFHTESEIALPVDAPRAAEKLAAEYGVQICRYGDEAEASVRALALRQRFTLDGLYAAGLLLTYLVKERISLTSALEKIPRVHVARRILPAGALSQGALQKFCGGNQLCRENASGILSFRPSRNGALVTVCAEAETMEAATELCAEAERLCGM